VRDGVLIAIQVGFQDNCVEGDNKTVIQAATGIQLLFKNTFRAAKSGCKLGSYFFLVNHKGITIQ